MMIEEKSDVEISSGTNTTNIINIIYPWLLITVQKNKAVMAKYYICNHPSTCINTKHTTASLSQFHQKRIIDCDSPLQKRALWSKRLHRIILHYFQTKNLMSYEMVVSLYYARTRH